MLRKRGEHLKRPPVEEELDPPARASGEAWRQDEIRIGIHIIHILLAERKSGPTVSTNDVVARAAYYLGLGETTLREKWREYCATRRVPTPLTYNRGPSPAARITTSDIGDLRIYVHDTRRGTDGNPRHC